MQNVKIYFLNNSELSEVEALHKGYRGDVYVKTVPDNIYHLHVYDIIRLKQDFETEIEHYGFFEIEPNVILVKEVTSINIKQTVEKLFARKFFDSLKQIKDFEINLNTLFES